MTRQLAPIASLLLLLALGLLTACGGKDTDSGKSSDSTTNTPIDVNQGDWTETKSGLKYQIVKAGEGPKATRGDPVSVHYTGTFKDGRPFDSSRGGKPFTFTVGVGGVIPGWDEALTLMSTGSRLKLNVPWKLAYGEYGNPPSIPGKTDLLFDVELLEILRPLTLVKPVGDAAKTLAGGATYQTLDKGAGDPPKMEQGVNLRLAIYNDKQRMVFSTDQAGQALGGELNSLMVAGKELPFLRPLVGQMCAGDLVAAEVPADQGFGDWTPDPRQIQPKSTTYWVLELRSINDIPEFVMPAAGNLTTTPSGLQYEVVKTGSGEKPTHRDSVSVMYTGWLEDGTVFDSGHGRGEPTSFPVGNVIPGWIEGVQLMQPGAIYRFVIPGKLAYGKTGSPPQIKPDATLIFLIELVSVKK